MKTEKTIKYKKHRFKAKKKLIDLLSNDAVVAEVDFTDKNHGYIEVSFGSNFYNPNQIFSQKLKEIFAPSKNGKVP